MLTLAVFGEQLVPALAHSTTALPPGLHRRWPVHWPTAVHEATMCGPAPQGSALMQQTIPVPQSAETAHSSCVVQPQLHEAQPNMGVCVRSTQHSDPC